MQAGLQLAVGQHSCAGEKPVNQDSMAARIPDGVESLVKGAAFAVADGISSSKVSQIAAETSVKALVTDYYATPQTWTAKTAAARVIQATNSWLFAQNRHQRTSDMNHGMVCTLSALILKACEAHVFHIGDSRVMRLSEGVLEPLTQDHVTVHSEEEQYLGRAIGAQHRVDIDYDVLPLSVGDVFLLTTDGVHDYVDAEIVRELLSKTSDLTQAAQELVHAALISGSTDNLTVQIVRVDSLPESDVLAAPGAELPVSTTLRPGEQLDDYTVVREVHHSNRSQLSLAMTADESRVALKVPGVEIVENPESLQRFLFEEWIARRVDSPHLVKAASADMPRSASYVALQWVEGTTLRQWLKDNPQPHIDDVRSIAAQIARGLRALHRQEMIHQDLRPENVMLDRQGTVVIVDLGSVAVAGLEQAVPGTLGFTPGTHQYTAPEYLSGDQVSWRSDQFSLGVIVYEMLTQKFPYGAQVARVRNRVDQQRLSYQSTYTDDLGIPFWLDAALARACHRDPHRRYDGLSEFIADLESPGSGYKAPESRPLIERNPLRFWKALAALQLVLIVFLVVIAAGR